MDAFDLDSVIGLSEQCRRLGDTDVIIMCVLLDGDIPPNGFLRQ